MKSIKELAWNVDEATYRNDKALSYSMLSKYDREGFEALRNHFKSDSSPSLLFGSCVDAIITGGQQEFDDRFTVIYSGIKPALRQAIDYIKETHGCMNVYKLSHEEILELLNEAGYAQSWKDETRIKVFLNDGKDYIDAVMTSGKTPVTAEMYGDVLQTVEALKKSEATEYYFSDESEEGIEKLYQLKFKATLKYDMLFDVPYRIMVDEMIVDHKSKTIELIDLKTSSKKEYEFPKSFLEWRYHFQARLYSRVIVNVIKDDDYFKDFTVLPFVNIVVNKESLTPLVWKSPFNLDYGDLKFGSKGQIVLTDPETVGLAIWDYLSSGNDRLPMGITDKHGEANDIEQYLNNI